MPKVSIIIPAYNAEHSIGRAIGSILAQIDRSEREIIVIDDRSGDGTRAAVDEMAVQFPEIKCVPNIRPKGPSGARNTGLLLATGEYVAFLDADDIWQPNHLKEGTGFLDQHPEIDVVFFNFGVAQTGSDEEPRTDWFSLRQYPRKLNHRELDEGFNLIEDDMFAALLQESFIHLQSMIFRRETGKDILFDEVIKRSEDRDFCLRLFYQTGATFSFKDVITSTYFRHDNSLTSGSAENHLATLLDHISLFKRYVQILGLDARRTRKIEALIAKKLMSASYAYRTMNQHGHAVASVFGSARYRCSFRQVIELGKIAISFAYSTARRR